MPAPPTGTPVDQKLYNEACHRIMELEAELQSKDERMGDWAEAADGEMSRLQTELETLGEAITLLKEFPPLVKAEAELQHANERIQAAIELLDDPPSTSVWINGVIAILRGQPT